MGLRDRWKLGDANARFSEVVRLAQSQGPQTVSVRGRDVVVIISVEEMERLASAEASPSLLSFLEDLKLEGLGLDREPDQGRDVEL